ncbi:uncharacterized protein I303_103577 [Kwoniella dejecticola CBS 10117]|uniref:Asl1-like glycosyl hydrolase catalytic domain-containing protein n=1 Tax=Kwoniella dejecticola CBS 10117 TaxID=1296121 RepID=A0A1A6A749_9TREE|nr:uncharacterized protein I303_03599 [Kwoniella dejecticola CBS 10117]OBR85885.1 hypothetical protein I303_03599 [Kwoniella dejecticola CBS 10117]
MTAIISLANLLPTLALLGAALSGIEQVPSALAHGPAARSPKDLYHKHLASRQKLADNVAARGTTPNKKGLIRRQADGSKCRVRGESYTAPSSSSAAAPASTSADAAAPTNNAVDAAAPSSAAAQSSSAAPAASSAASTPSYSGGANGGSVNVGSKLGIAWPNGDWEKQGAPNWIGNYIGNKASWYYTWSPFSVSTGDELGLEYVPMLWGPGHVGDWYAQQGSWPSTVKNALFFNEPNQKGQCDVAAADAVQYWINDYLPLRSKGIRLGQAAPTNAPDGLVWVQDFQKACTDQGHSQADCTADFYPVHYYDTNVQRFQEYVTNYHNAVGGNLWVTEYACQDYNGGAQCSDQDTWNFHTQMAGWFESQSYIERFSPFGVMKDMQGVNQANALMNPDGSITSLGGWYITTA